MAPVITQLDPPQRRGVTLLAVLAALLVGAALAAIAWGLGGSVRVVVDGTTRSVSPGTTVGDLALWHYTNGKPGAMYSAKGGIISQTGGEPVSFVRNGRLVATTQRLFDGDDIRSQNGVDDTERVITVKESIDPTATIEGTGPILKVVRQGTPGTSLVRKGAISGAIVSHTTLAPAENIILQASMPTSADKIVALTFDDGPSPTFTLRIVDILKRAGVPATFFELGEEVRRTPQLSAAIVAAGNVIGNHSWSHPWLTKMKSSDIRKQILESAAAIRKASGTSPTVFRPPYGAINRRVWAQAKATREMVVLWDVDSLDWTRPGPSKIVHNVTSHMGRASVVLMHDGGGDRTQTIAALPQVITWLKAQGYTFVTVPQLEAAK